MNKPKGDIKKMVKEKTSEGFLSLFEYVHHKIRAVNDSKIFAGIMIIIINIASKFVTFKVSKTMESYLKFNFSRDILVFAITWMGTRDVYIAVGMTLLFVFLADYLFNENSALCCLPKSVTNKQVAKLNEPAKLPTPEEVIKARLVLERAGVSGGGGGNNDLADAQMNPTVYKESFTMNTTVG
jgi:hypothetical protein